MHEEEAVVILSHKENAVIIKFIAYHMGFEVCNFISYGTQGM